VVSCLDCAMDDLYISEQQHEQALQKAELLAKQFKSFTLYLSRN